MGIIAIKLDGKLYRILFFFACICAFTIVDSLAQKRRMINCRRYVFAPQCRGIAAKRDIGRITDDLRFPINNDDRDYIVAPDQESFIQNSLNMKGILGDLYRKSITKNNDYETGNENYLK